MERELRQPWAERWQTAQTRWDQGKEHPLLPELLSLAEIQGRLPKKAAIYSAGCGRAHSEASMAHRGYEVLACDFVLEAVKAAQEKYAGTPHLTIEQRDGLVVQPDELGRFNAVFDRAMLCALQPQNRETYINACWQRLKPHGLFMGILFTETTNGPGKGPPFEISIAQLMELFGRTFSLVALESRRSHLNPDDIIREEAVAVWMRREK